MTDEQKAWIDNASLEELLRRWRFAKAGEDDIFQGEAGKYFADVMFLHRKADLAGWVTASKRVGWDDHGVRESPE